MSPYKYLKMKDYLPDFRLGVSKQDTALTIKEQIKYILHDPTILFVDIYIHETHIHTHTHIPIDMFKIVHSSIVHNSKIAVT